MAFKYNLLLELFLNNNNLPKPFTFIEIIHREPGAGFPELGYVEIELLS